MKKRILSVLVLLVVSSVLVLLSSCSVSVTPQYSTSDSASKEQHITTAGGKQIMPLEPDKKDLPSYADLSKVKPGMTKDEVFALVGNPQREIIRRMPVYEATSLATDTICHIYDSNDGDSICVVWGYANTQSTSVVVLKVVPEVSE